LLTKEEKQLLINTLEKMSLAKKQQAMTSQIINQQLNVKFGSIENENILDSNDFLSILKEAQACYQNDILAKTTIDLLIAPLRDCSYKIESNNNLYSQKAKKLVEDTLNNLAIGYTTFVNHCLYSLIVGCQFFEIIWEASKIDLGDGVEGIYNRIVDLNPIKVENIIEFLFDRKGNFAGIKVKDLNDNQDKVIKRQDLFFVSHNSLFNDIRGQSELRAILLHSKLKQKILIASAKTVARGVGVPVAYAKNTIDTRNIDAYKTLLKTISNSDSAYALVYQDDIERIDFLTIQQSNAMPLLEFINRDIFFNTLTQFLTTGLGQNGARATAGELKSPYEIKLSAIQREIEAYLQEFCNIIVKNSFLGFYLKNEDYPRFKFLSLQQTDLQRFASVISTLVGAGLTLTEEEKESIKEIIGLKKSKNIELINRKKELRRNKYTEADLKLGADEVIQEIDQVTNEFNLFFTDWLKDIITNLLLQKKAGFSVDWEKLKNKLVEKIKTMKEDLQKQAVKTIETEIKKMNKKLTRYDLIKLTGEDEIVNRLILKIVDLVKENDSIKDFEDLFKKIEKEVIKDRNEISRDIEKSYLDQRGEILQKQENIQRFQYTSCQDSNVCESCNSLHSLVFTRDEIQQAGLNFDSPVNPNCLGLLGGNVCRCHWKPVS